MTTFEQREHDFETRFKHDLELQFKVKARRNRLLGLWAAERMGLSGSSAEAYARELVEDEITCNDTEIISKIVADLSAQGESCTPAQARFQLEHLETEARQQIMAE